MADDRQSQIGKMGRMPQATCISGTSPSQTYGDMLDEETMSLLWYVPLRFNL